MLCCVHCSSTNVIDRNRHHAWTLQECASDSGHHLLFAGGPFSPAGLLCAFHLGGSPVSSECGGGLGSDHVLQLGSGTLILAAKV